MNRDLEDLKLLSTFHYVLAGLTAATACIPFIHLFLGIFFLVLSSQPNPGKDLPPPAFGLLFIIVALIVITIGWTLAICIFLAGKKLARQVNYEFCMVLAAFECLSLPLGTVLGVFTLVVLSRKSVRELFQSKQG